MKNKLDKKKLHSNTLQNPGTLPIKLEASSRSAIIRFQNKEDAEKAVYALKGVPVTTGNGLDFFLEFFLVLVFVFACF